MIAVILSSQFIEINLQVEFGKILPIELPLFNKTLFDHQLKSLEGISTEVFITLPKGYSPHLVEFENVIFVDYDLSLLDLLRDVSKRFKQEESLYIYYGDTLILNSGDLLPDINYAFIQRPKFQYEWASTALNGYVYAGGFILKNELLYRCINGASDFMAFLENLNNSALVENYTDFSWFDFGHPFTYYDSRKQFLESRSFNRLVYKNGYLKKSSSDILKVWSEYNWLKNAKKVLSNNVPQVKGFNIKAFEACYEVEYINKAVLSDVFVFGKQPPELIIEILKSIKVQLDILVEKSSSFINSDYSIPNKFINLKLKERESDIIQLFLNDDQALIKIKNYIIENLDYFENKSYTVVAMHGDLCFSNIIYDFSLFSPIFIDPRGYLSREEGFSFSGPKVYDILKLAHSYVGGYDFVITGYYNNNFFEIRNLNERLTQFIQIFEIERAELIMGMKNLFLSMLPLHKESKERISGFLFILNKLDQL